MWPTGLRSCRILLNRFGVSCLLICLAAVGGFRAKLPLAIWMCCGAVRSSKSHVRQDSIGEFSSSSKSLRGGVHGKSRGHSNPTVPDYSMPLLGPKLKKLCLAAMAA